jgi:hypothetical protein
MAEILALPPHRPAYRWVDLMPDGLELFPPGVVLGSPDRDGLGCTAPLGRRRSPRPQPALRPYRAPNPTFMMLAGIRAQLDAGFRDHARALGRVDRDLVRNNETTAELVELVERLLARLTALERAAGLVEKPQTPRPSRRNPCP